MISGFLSIRVVMSHEKSPKVHVKAILRFGYEVFLGILTFSCQSKIKLL